MLSAPLSFGGSAEGMISRVNFDGGEELSAEEKAEIEALIQKRAEARKAKDWATADAIRDELAARHVVMKDTPGGVEWHVEG